MTPHNAIFWWVISNRGSLRKKKGIFMKEIESGKREKDPLPPQKRTEEGGRNTGETLASVNQTCPGVIFGSL